MKFPKFMRLTNSTIPDTSTPATIALPLRDNEFDEAAEWATLYLLERTQKDFLKVATVHQSNTS